mmetsp:Transcript_42153/g.40389  ORF Transcript_42153/g.40389 Transcript_42153/m.40389 type:complete len:99 (-) Transcript_42153:231-527(-)
MSLLKNQLKMEKDVEIQRESLFSHENFSAIDAFKLIDQDNKGFVTVEDMENVAQRFNIDLISTQTVMNLFDRDQDGQMNFMEFTKSITPKNTNYLNSS